MALNVKAFRTGLEKFVQSAAGDFIVKKMRTSPASIKKRLSGVVDDQLTSNEAIFEPLLDDNPVFAYSAARVLQAIGNGQARPIRKQKLDIAEEQILIVNGDLDVKGDIRNSYGLLVVLGNLKIGGSYIDQYHEPHQSMLIVLGSLQASSILTGGELMVHGDLHATNLLFGEDNHHSLLVAGTATAPIVIRQYDHDMRFGKLAAGVFFDGNRSSEEIRRTVQDRLPDVASENEYGGLDFDQPKLLAHIAKRAKPGNETHTGVNVREMARAALAHGRSESFVTALGRLQKFAAAGKKAGLQRKHHELKVKTAKPPTAAEIKAIESKLGVRLPPSLAEFLGTIGWLTVRGPNCTSLDTWAKASKLDFDTNIGQDHDSSEYANLYGKTKKNFDPDAASENFVRISLGEHFIEDEDEREDGDVITLILEKQKHREVPVWDVPRDDGYSHEKRGDDVHEWFSHVVDRLIRCTYIFWSGRRDELKALDDRADFDYGLDE
jgi:hypothetical protein